MPMTPIIRSCEKICRKTGRSKWGFKVQCSKFNVLGFDYVGSIEAPGMNPIILRMSIE
jgi:hypothetical protein